jgi:hypothetical protein
MKIVYSQEYLFLTLRRPSTSSILWLSPSRRICSISFRRPGSSSSNGSNLPVLCQHQLMERNVMGVKSPLTSCLCHERRRYEGRRESNIYRGLAPWSVEKRSGHPRPQSLAVTRLGPLPAARRLCGHVSVSADRINIKSNPSVWVPFFRVSSKSSLAPPTHNRD